MTPHTQTQTPTTDTHLGHDGLVDTLVAAVIHALLEGHVDRVVLALAERGGANGFWVSGSGCYFRGTGDPTASEPQVPRSM